MTPSLTPCPVCHRQVASEAAILNPHSPKYGLNERCSGSGWPSRTDISTDERFARVVDKPAINVPPNQGDTDD